MKNAKNKIKLKVVGNSLFPLSSLEITVVTVADGVVKIYF